MSHLKLVYLHDNLLSSYDDVKYLSATPGLEVLTLYDTPLSLKKNYRHHVVNSVWTLKVHFAWSVFGSSLIDRFP